MVNKFEDLVSKIEFINVCKLRKPLEKDRMNLLCKIALHSWERFKEGGKEYRICCRCGKKEKLGEIDEE